MGLTTFVLIFCGALIVGILWQAFLYRIWGARTLGEQFSGRVLYLKTKQGEYRFDKVHKKFSYKLKGDTGWWSKDFDQVRTLSIHHSDDTASMIEFLIGEWNIFDLAGRYRDLVHTYTISIKVGRDEFIPIYALKQYEQRDWFFGQLYLDFCIWVLKHLGMYRDVQDVSEALAKQLSDKVAVTGLELSL